LRRLLAEGVSNITQADGEIHEDQFPKFLANSLTRKSPSHSLKTARSMLKKPTMSSLARAPTEPWSQRPCEKSEDALHETRFSTVSAPNSIWRRSNKSETRSLRRTSRRRQRQLSVSQSEISRQDHPAQLLRHKTQALETAS